MTKFLTVLIKFRDCFYSFGQFTDGFLKLLVLCRALTERKAFAIKLKTVDSTFDNLADQKALMTTWKSYSRNARSRISGSTGGGASLLGKPAVVATGYGYGLKMATEWKEAGSRSNVKVKFKYQRIWKPRAAVCRLSQWRNCWKSGRRFKSRFCWKERKPIL